MDQRYMQRQIRRTPSFEIGKISVADSRGRASVQTGERADPRTGLFTVLAQPLQSGCSALMLAGGDNDRASVLGISPFIGG